MGSDIEYSIIIPVYNEEPNVLPLYNKLKKVLESLGKYEIIFVDDGSKDQTFKKLLELSKINTNLKIVKLRKNFGQSAALTAGFDHASGGIIVTMDGDLQNDPKDVPKLVEKIKEGYDGVCGWRKNRKDPFFRKILPSKLFNWWSSKLFGLPLNDLSCTLRAYRDEVIKDVDLYGEMHRYIPVLASWRGYEFGEVEVKHHPRVRGETKYGGGRLIRGLLDSITVYFINKYLSRPMHFFGILGLASVFIGVITGIYLVILKFLYGVGISDKPLLLLAITLIILGIQMLMLGLLGEMLNIHRYEAEKKAFYRIKTRINFDSEV